MEDMFSEGRVNRRGRKESNIVPVVGNVTPYWSYAGVCRRASRRSDKISDIPARDWMFHLDPSFELHRERNEGSPVPYYARTCRVHNVRCASQYPIQRHKRTQLQSSHYSIC